MELLNCELVRIPFHQEKNLHFSRSLSRKNNLNISLLSFICKFDLNKGEITLFSHSTINIDDLPVEKIIDSNHGGTVIIYQNC
jgi:hypothetical protein